MQFTEVDLVEENNLKTLRMLTQFVEGQAGGHAFQYQLAPTHQARTEALEGMLAYCYASLVRNRHLNNKQSEDELTVQIVAQLVQFQVVATHDTQIGGHCDIVVAGPNHYQWIGEAKIHSSYQWLCDGFLQLSTRYGTAMPGQSQGEVIIYCRSQNALRVLQNWKEKLEELGLARVIDDRCCEDLWFRTSHLCRNSGLEFSVRHVIVPLHFAPEK